MNILCTICSDLVNPAENIYVTKCGHIFHHNCLSQWLVRSRTCPQCRNKVSDKCMFRLYPTVSNEQTGDDAATLQSRLDDAHLQLRQQKTVVKDKDDKITVMTSDLKKQEDLLKSYEKRLVSFDSKVLALREQLEYANIQSKETQKYKQENEQLKKTMQTLNDLQRVLNATSSEVEEMLKGYSDVQTIATFATALKRALCESEAKKNSARDRYHKLTQKLALEKKSVTDLQAKVTKLEDELHQATRKVEELQLKKDREKDIYIESTIGLPVCFSSLVKNEPPSPKNPDSANSSFNTMVNKIENSDSPYLSLKQGNIFSLAALQSKPLVNGEKRPLDIGTILKNAQRISTSNISIFHKKQPLRMEKSSDNENSSPLNVSYDGLGGHSKVDTFPVPKKASPLKSKVPKLSAKHKLKRPNPSGCKSIDQMLKKRKSE